MKHTWKKGLSLLLTFCLLAGLLPALSVSAADVTETEVTDWAALTASENNSVADVTTVDGTTTVALKTYVKTTDTLTVPAGKYVLDLHNYGIRFTGDAGSAITVGAGAELTLEDTNRFSWAPTNYITLNESGRGTSAGSAYSSGATSVNRGYITGGNGVGNLITAGGVHVSADGKFIMNGGAIIGNYATAGGGVYIDPVWSASAGTESGSFTMNGGEITKNTAGGSGGGVYVNGNGVSSAASFTMTGGSITNNTAGAGASTSMGGDGGDGGGVFARGSVTISGSSAITGNTTVGNEYGALGRGGGVYVHCGNMLSVSGTPNITGNTAGRVGVDGVHADNAFLATTTAIDSAKSGTQATITVTGTLDSAARIGVTVEGTGAENTTVPFTSGLSGKGEASNFTSDAEYAITLENNEAALDIGSYAVQIGSAKYTSLATAMTALKNGDTLTLLGDVTTDGGLLFEGNKAVTLDLNGYGVRFTGSYGSVITVDSDVHLTLTDSAEPRATRYIALDENGRGVAVGDASGTGTVPVTGGYITGGSSRVDGGNIAVSGGGVRVYPDAVFTMNAGTILGNTANDGGGVYVVGTGAFKMNGGSISNNTAGVGEYGGNGGGVYVSQTGAFTMTGGSIADNTAGFNKLGGAGGGVYGNKNLTISGGSVIGNKAVAGTIWYSGAGGGIYVQSTGELRISGAVTIKDNSAALRGGGVIGSNNVFLSNSAESSPTTLLTPARLVVTGALTGADIGVTAEAVTTKGETAAIAVSDGEYSLSPADAETLHGEGGCAVALDGGVVKLSRGDAAAAVSFTALPSFNAALSAWKNGTTLTLLQDMAITETIEAPTGSVLDLNGYGLTYSGAGASAIHVGSGAAMTLTDSGGSGQTHRFSLNADGLAVLDPDGTITVGGYLTTGGTARGVTVEGGMFILRGGAILGSAAAGNGGGVSVGGSDGRFDMYGGIITGNTAGGNGGGVYVSSPDTVHMGWNSETDVPITGNTAAGAGGGVFVDAGGTFEVHSLVTITGNRAGAEKAASNVGLLHNENHTSFITSYSSGPADGASIGVSVYKYDGSGYTPITVEDLPVAFYTGSSTDRFTSDQSFEMGAGLVSGKRVRFLDSNSGSSVAASQIVIAGKQAVMPANPTRTGYAFGGWYTTYRLTDAYDFASPVTADISLYAKWTEAVVNTGSDDYSGDSGSPSSSPAANNSYSGDSGSPSSSPAANNSTAPASTDADGNTTLNVSATVASDGTATVGAVSDAAIAAIAASEEPQRNVVFDLSGLGDNVTTVSLSADTFAAVADALSEREGSGDSVTIVTSTGEVQFSENAVAAIAEAIGSDAKGAVALSLESGPVETLNDAQQEALKEVETLAKYALTLTVGGETVSDFRGGAVTVGLPFTPRAGTLARDYRVYYAGTDGTLQRMPTGYSGGKLTFRTSHFSDYVIVYEKLESLFEDVKNATDYYYDAVLWACGNGITEGKTATLFAPADTCTRAQMVTFLWRASGSPTLKSTANPFGDVAESSYYYPAVLWAVENGITEGTGDGSTFSPDETVTRGQAVTFLYRLAGRKAAAERSFTDAADENAYFYDAVQWAIANGVTKGETETTFAPQAPCLRGQVMTFLYRTYVD